MRDLNLINHLKDETEGITQWALEGLHRLIANNYKFTSSNTSDMAIEAYRMKLDPLYRFVQEHCVLTENKEDRIPKTDFENDYEKWAKENDVSSSIRRRDIKDRQKKKE